MKIKRWIRDGNKEFEKQGQTRTTPDEKQIS